MAFDCKSILNLVAAINRDDLASDAFALRQHEQQRHRPQLLRLSA